MTAQTDNPVHNPVHNPVQARAQLVWVDVDLLEDNPENSRTFKTDTELNAHHQHMEDTARSIMEVGVLQPPLVVPGEGERWVLYVGHTRRDSARRAAEIAATEWTEGLEPGSDEHTSATQKAQALRCVPCYARPDLAEQVGMDAATAFAENERRLGLTAGQKVRAAENIALFEGWTAQRVSRLSGMKPAEVRAARRIGRLPETTQASARDAQLSFVQLGELEELARRGTPPEKLERIAASSMFAHDVAEESKRLDRVEAAQELVRVVLAQGWQTFELPEGWPTSSTMQPLERLADPETGDLLLARGADPLDPDQAGAAAVVAADGHGVLIDRSPWLEPSMQFVCADPVAHGHHELRRGPVTPHAAGVAAVEHDDVVASFAAGEHSDPTGHGEDPYGDPYDGDPHDGDPHDGDPYDASADAGGDHVGGAGHGHGASVPLDDLAGLDPVEVEERARQRREADEEAMRVRREREAAAEAARIAAETERRARVEARERHVDELHTAAGVRWTYVTELAGNQKNAAKHLPLLTMLVARWPQVAGWGLDQLGHEDDETVVTQLCPDPDNGLWSDAKAVRRAVLAAAWALQDNLRQVAALSVDQVTTNAEPEDLECGIWFLEYLQGAKHTLHPRETELLTDMGSALAVLRGEDADGTDDATDDDGDGGVGETGERGDAGGLGAEPEVDDEPAEGDAGEDDAGEDDAGEDDAEAGAETEGADGIEEIEEIDGVHEVAGVEEVEEVDDMPEAA